MLFCLIKIIIILDNCKLVYYVFLTVELNCSTVGYQYHNMLNDNFKNNFMMTLSTGKVDRCATYLSAVGPHHVTSEGKMKQWRSGP